MREKKTYAHHATGLVNLTSEQFVINDIRIIYRGITEGHSTTGYMGVKYDGGRYQIGSVGVCKPYFSSGVCGWTEWDGFTLHDLTRPDHNFDHPLLFEQSFNEVYRLNHGDGIIIDCLSLELLDGMTMREAIRGRRTIDSDWSASVV